MGDRAPGAKAVERAVRPSGKTRDEEVCVCCVRALACARCCCCFF
jgi:hypothetical protein